MGHTAATTLAFLRSLRLGGLQEQHGMQALLLIAQVW